MYSANLQCLYQVLAFCSTLLHGGKLSVQQRFMKIFLDSREEPFFANIKFRMAQTEEALRSHYSLAN